MWPHGLLCCAKPPEKAAFPREGKRLLIYLTELFFRYPRGIFLNFFKALRTDDMLHTAGVLGRCLGRDTQTNQAVRQQAVTLIHAPRRRAARLCQTDEAVMYSAPRKRPMARLTLGFVNPSFAAMSMLRTAPFSFWSTRIASR